MLASVATRPEHLLIRWSPAGGIQAAHAVYRQIGLDGSGNIVLQANGEALLDKIGKPSVLAVGGDEMAALVGQAVIDLTGELWARELDLLKMTEKAKAAISELFAARKQVSDLEARLATISSSTEQQPLE